MKPEWSCLNDVTIIDLSQLLPGPHATSLLLQLGADVVKVEPLGTGDSSRQLGEAVFAQFNRGKRSVALDLKTVEGKAAFLDLVRNADAVVEGYRPGVMQRLGLGYDALAKINPKIVLCSISGFGQTGPYSSHAGHDLNYLALSGFWSIPAQVNDKVARPRVRVADYAASGYAALALTVAIVSARQSGKGQHLDVSIHDAIMSWTAPAAWAARGYEDCPQDSPIVMPDNDIFETRDGRHLALGILENKFWVNLCDALDVAFPALADKRFATRVGRQQFKSEVNALLKTIFATYPLSEWIEILSQFDLPFSPLLSASELFSDPHVLARDMVREMASEKTIALKFPVKFSLGLPEGNDHVPLVGEHNG